MNKKDTRVVEYVKREAFWIFLAGAMFTGAATAPYWSKNNENIEDNKLERITNSIPTSIENTNNSYLRVNPSY